ncbi:MAG: hypothetical protein AB7N73_14925 [Gemmatimonadales bacterium]
MSRPTEETIGPRYVARSLERAEEALVAAQKATEDRAIADELERIRRKLGPVLKRARLVLKDADLRSATQPDFLDPTQGVTS